MPVKSDTRDNLRRFMLTGTRHIWHADGDYSWTLPEIEPSPAENEVIELVEAAALEAERARRERAEAELHALKDFRARLAFFDDADQPVLMPWIEAHKHHRDEPYIGCPFCRERFVAIDGAERNTT